MRLRVGGTLASAVLAVVLGACTAASDTTQVMATSSSVAPPPLSPTFLGVLQRVHHGGTWEDPRDAPVGWVDVTRVRYSNIDDDPSWVIELAAKPPPLRSREPALLIAYGLVLDTTGDGIADYLVCIDDDAPRATDFHVWVRDLRTGETDEQIGPPYGLPIEFGRLSSRSLYLGFLNGAVPADLDPETVRFYAWASASRNGEVFASDYAPDTDWMTRT